MIFCLEALHYKCLRYVSVNLGQFHILIGPNASGKSTFPDVISFLGDMINKGPEQAVLKRAQSLQELMREVLRVSRIPFSSSLHAKLAKTVSLRHCSDPAFCQMRYYLTSWFGLKL